VSWIHLSDSNPKARKNYRCRVCYETIQVGETHVARRGIGDDGPDTCRMHSECCDYMDAENDQDIWELAPGFISRAEILALVPTTR